MRITSLTLKNFRCFPLLTLNFERPIIVLVGANGVGKTSLLEALHYACYLRSFKTHTQGELVRLTQEPSLASRGLAPADTTESSNIPSCNANTTASGNFQSSTADNPKSGNSESYDSGSCSTSASSNHQSDEIGNLMGSGKSSDLQTLKKHAIEHSAITGFSISLAIAAHDVSGIDQICVHLVDGKRSVKVNQKLISSYKELSTLYKVITMTEDDLDLIKGAPTLRRTFIDQLLSMLDPSYAPSMRQFRATLENRNALLNRYNGNQESYELWTQQLLKASSVIQKKRLDALALLSQEAQKLADDFFDSAFSIELSYSYAKPYGLSGIDTVKNFLQAYPHAQRHELAFGRSLFGIHLDDISITFQDKASRTFASRGQQKLIIFLIKIAIMNLITNKSQLNLTASQPLPPSVIFLIDDFMTDFDEKKLESLFALIIKSASQVIVTTPIGHGPLATLLSRYSTQIVHLE